MAYIRIGINLMTRYYRVDRVMSKLRKRTCFDETRFIEVRTDKNGHSYHVDIEDQDGKIYCFRNSKGRLDHLIEIGSFKMSKDGSDE